MTVRILSMYPPNYAAIRKAFPLSGKEIFSYNNAIYNPGRGRVGPELIAHEQVHFGQQGEDSNGWWEKYIVSAEFRLEQELEAHQAEYKTFCQYNRNTKLQSRFLHAISKRLSAPMYGNLITTAEAVKRIRQ